MIKNTLWLVYTFVVSFFIGGAYAQAGEQVVLSCHTKQDKELLIVHDEQTDMFTVLYGKSVEQPEFVSVKDGNNMGTSYRYSSAYGTSNREIYLNDGQLFTTIGVTDDGTQKDAYIITNNNDKSIINDNCASNVQSRFGFSEIFKNLTEVDDE